MGPTARFARMRLLLHAGTHKTGTSTIQRVLHGHRDGLAEIGLRYPDPAPWFGDTYLAHHPVVHAVARRDAGELARARDFLVAARDAAGDHDTVLLSAEPVYRHVLAGHQGRWWRRHRAFLQALASELDDLGFEVEVVLVFRRRDAFIESIYHERVAHGFGEPFEAMLGNADRLLDYDRQLKQFGETFPTVTALRYEDLAGPDLTPAFVRALGFEPPALDRAEWERRSTDARLSLWMASAYAEDPDEELVTQRRRFGKNPVSDELFDDFGRVTLWADPAARRELLDRYGDHDPVTDDRPVAHLTPEVERRIDEAFDRYLEAKGLTPTGRAARRPA